MKVNEESFDEFVKSILKEEPVDNTLFGLVARWDKENPQWNLFLVYEEKGTTYCGGHYPLSKVEMKDFTNIISFFSEQNRKIIIDTEGYYAER